MPVPIRALLPNEQIVHLPGNSPFNPTGTWVVARTDLPPAKSISWLPFRSGTSKSHTLTFLPRGFAQMAVIDLHDFNRQTYRFEYVRREFLGEVRCLVFDVAPLQLVETQGDANAGDNAPTP